MKGMTAADVYNSCTDAEAHPKEIVRWLIQFSDIDSQHTLFDARIILGLKLVPITLTCLVLLRISYVISSPTFHTKSCSTNQTCGHCGLTSVVIVCADEWTDERALLLHMRTFVSLVGAPVYSFIHSSVHSTACPFSRPLPSHTLHVPEPLKIMICIFVDESLEMARDGTEHLAPWKLLEGFIMESNLLFAPFPLAKHSCWCARFIRRPRQTMAPPWPSNWRFLIILSSLRPWGQKRAPPFKIPCAKPGGLSAKKPNCIQFRKCLFIVAGGFNLRPWHWEIVGWPTNTLHWGWSRQPVWNGDPFWAKVYRSRFWEPRLLQVVFGSTTVQHAGELQGTMGMNVYKLRSVKRGGRGGQLWKRWFARGCREKGIGKPNLWRNWLLWKIRSAQNCLKMSEVKSRQKCARSCGDAHVGKSKSFKKLAASDSFESKIWKMHGAW